MQRDHAEAALVESEFFARAGGLDALAHHLERVDHDVADALDFLGGHAFVAQVFVHNRSTMASVARRLISSGMRRSRLRRPASRCTVGMPSLAPTMAQATVALT